MLWLEVGAQALQWAMLSQGWEPPAVPTYGPEQYLIGIVIVVGVPLLCCFVVYKFWSKKRETARPDREIIRERVLVICPYCSAKIPQGVTFCPHCGGKL